MKLLVSIGSCWRDVNNGANESMRLAWLNDLNALGTDHRFFLGSTKNFIRQLDAEHLDTEDDYAHLSLKTKFACQYAIERGYTHLFQCFTDTYVRPERLLTSGSWLHPYTGYHGGHLNVVNYASGGAGYWLDRRCMELIVNADGYDWAEDRWVGNILAKAGIHCVFDGRYRPKRYDITPNNDIISTHLSLGEGKYDSAWMSEVHALWEKEKRATEVAHSSLLSGQD
jgi:hypothetical protein